VVGPGKRALRGFESLRPLQFSAKHEPSCLSGRARQAGPPRVRIPSPAPFPLFARAGKPRVRKDLFCFSGNRTPRGWSRRFHPGSRREIGNSQGLADSEGLGVRLAPPAVAPEGRLCGGSRRREAIRVAATGRRQKIQRGPQSVAVPEVLTDERG